ncbi:MAG: tRNA (cytidine(34)-2'-O)-methyltransferase [Phycisphaerales bacterium]
MARLTEPLLNIVLVNPEIPNNTGNIGRTCAATGCRLHIVRPVGFDLSEKAVRRAGLDYWHLVDCVEHESWEAFRQREFAENSGRPPAWLYTTHSDIPHWSAAFQRGDYLLFGRETSGVDDAVHQWVRTQHGEDHRITLPMVDDPAARSLNVATAVCAAVYEAMRQIESRSLPRC